MSKLSSSSNKILCKHCTIEANADQEYALDRDLFKALTECNNHEKPIISACISRYKKKRTRNYKRHVNTYEIHKIEYEGENKWYSK